MAEAVLTQDTSRTVKSARYGETYHSKFGAVSESRYVFLERSGVLERLNGGKDTRVLEIGFGLGLNFLLTADAALSRGVNLEYHAFEHDLVDRETFVAMGYRAYLSQPELVDQLGTELFSDAVDFKSILAEGHGQAAGTANQSIRRVSLGGARDASIELLLSLEDVASWELWPVHTQTTRFNAVYLDAFSPETNAECWTESFLSRLYEALTPEGGTLTTYCAKGVVRRRLDAVGCNVTRHPGPTGKREILSATRLG